MKTTSILNLKGGVGKTITAVNLAYNLATTHNQRTLLIDIDKQASTTKFFDLHNPATAGITEILINEQPAASQILKTQYANLHLISSNMNTMNASRIINQDNLNPREYRLKNALKSIQENYDYCIIDNPPDLEMSTVNALAASDNVIIPIKIDKFAFDGLFEIITSIQRLQQVNPKLHILGCFLTMVSNTTADKQGIQWLKSQQNLPTFETTIRKTTKVNESTFVSQPLTEYAKKNPLAKTAAADYLALTAEIMHKIKEESQNGI